VAEPAEIIDALIDKACRYNELESRARRLGLDNEAERCRGIAADCYADAALIGEGRRRG
jgi:hypothetical protein